MNHIIRLPLLTVMVVDVLQVTDKFLFQEGANDLGNIKDKRIKDDEFIYMVLEYGEIDLAHMLSQKWKEMGTPGWRIDENWLRFYWQVHHFTIVDFMTLRYNTSFCVNIKFASTSLGLFNNRKF